MSARSSVISPTIPAAREDRTLVIVEAYLEFTPDFEKRTIAGQAVAGAAGRGISLDEDTPGRLLARLAEDGMPHPHGRGFLE